MKSAERFLLDEPLALKNRPSRQHSCAHPRKSSTPKVLNAMSQPKEENTAEEKANQEAEPDLSEVRDRSLSPSQQVLTRARMNSRFANVCVNLRIRS